MKFPRILLLVVPVLLLSLVFISSNFAVGNEEKEGNGGEPMPELKTTIKTSQGDITLELYPNETPITVANFVFLSKRGFYDDVLFHRVIANFMIQGGDPTGTGTGGPGYNIEDEYHPDLRHDSAGILSTANTGRPNSNGSQFFITHGPTPHLDNKHSVFGKVLEGQDVVDAIRQGDKIESISFEGDTAALLEAHAERVKTWEAKLGD